MTLCASGFVTTTSTVAGECAVVVPLIAVALSEVIVSADPPKDAVVPDWKPLPAMVTPVPPTPEPLFGVTEMIAGGGGGVN